MHRRFPWSKFRILAGLLLLLLSVFLLISFVSYLYGYFSGGWQQDDIFSYNKISLHRIFTDSTLIVNNLTGRLGAALSYVFLKRWFGIAAFVFPFLFFIFGIRLMFKRSWVPLAKSFELSVLLLVLLSCGFSFLFRTPDFQILGGVFGHICTTFLEGALGVLGTGFLLLFLYLAFGVLVFNVSFNFLQQKNELKSDEIIITSPVQNPAAIIPEPDGSDNIFEFDLKKRAETKPAPLAVEETEELLVSEVIPTVLDPLPPRTLEKKVPEAIADVPFAVNETKDEAEDNTEDEEGTEEKEVRKTNLDTPYDPTQELSSYKFPPLELLSSYGSGVANVRKEELEENKNKIVQTLNNYSIQIDKIIATIGPTVTLYEIVPAPGIRISKIKNLEDDIALSLSAYGIRIIAPIPGKGTIGIEVPNQNPEVVSMRSVMASEKFQSTKFELPIALGKTISNETYIADLTKMPHLLMAGATGQGKSVGLNAIITSLLYKKHPAEVKFVMVDPKKVELSLFNKIERHYLAKLPDFEEAIITDTRKVVRVLNSLLIEMDNRYNLLKDAQVRNIKEYNTKFIARKLNPNNGHHFMPYIIVVVDEFADLIMTAGKEIETPLTRLAQLARAIGIHLIIATQRPSVNIITGTIKANFPARAAFRVISKIDSRTILDTGGADQLIGRGDMLLSMGSDLIRLQCAFIDTPEIDKVTEFIGSQRAYPNPFMLPEYFEEGEENGKDVDLSDRDDMFEEAARCIVQYQQGSTSLLQRKLKLGYNRAGRIMDQLEAMGIVGPFEGSKAREVRIKDMEALKELLKNYF